MHKSDEKVQRVIVMRDKGISSQRRVSNKAETFDARRMCLSVLYMSAHTYRRWHGIARMVAYNVSLLRVWPASTQDAAREATGKHNASGAP